MIAVLSFGLQAEKPAHADATFIVNSTGDTPDADPGDGTCETATASECTLRAAIQEANATSGADEIHFSILAAQCNAQGVCTITPTSSDLPMITEQVTIDGYSQTGASPATASSHAVLKIELDGTNAFNGLLIQAPNSTVKGLIINRFGNPGVWIISGFTGNKVEGNYLGTNADGTEAPGNPVAGSTGVRIEGSNNTVGDTEPGARNIISGNDIGVFILGTGNEVMGNYIGTDKTGMVTDPDGIPNNGDDLGNFIGVDINGTTINGGSSNTVGGTAAGARNVISGTRISPGNDEFGNGVLITGPLATDNKVEGNYIGINAAGDAKLANAKNGVHIQSEASNNTIGGTTPEAGNIISGNGGDGVEVSYYHVPNDPGASDDTPPTGNRILSNSIYDNDALGIDLTTPPNDPAGVTNNDNKDPDKGANNLQNFPVLSPATLSGGQITLSGLLNSRPRKTFTIQFFSSPTADSSGFGEGKTYLGEIQVKTNRKGKRSFSTTFTPAQPVSAGEKITATATNNLTGDTSEFSKAVDAS